MLQYLNRSNLVEASNDLILEVQYLDLHHEGHSAVQKLIQLARGETGPLQKCWNWCSQASVGRYGNEHKQSEYRQEFERQHELVLELASMLR